MRAGESDRFPDAGTLHRGTKVLVDQEEPGGWLAIEVDCTRARASARRAAELGWDAVAMHADLYGRERYLLARRSATR